MAIPTFTIRQMLEAGIHFGHHPRRWNPRMEPYLFGVRNNVHVINLEKTVPMLEAGLRAVHDVVTKGGRVLFVGTKPAASAVIAEAAKRCGQYYVNHRWLGGMMTNWKTVSRSIKRLGEYEEALNNPEKGLTKKEILQLTREREKLERAIGGIREMGGVPNILFIIDTNKEQTAIKEARKLGLPIVGIVDSNSDPSDIDFPIPGNDDALRSIRFFCDLFAGTVLDGLSDQMVAAGIDLGEATELPASELQAIESAKLEKKFTKLAQKAVAEAEEAEAISEGLTVEDVTEAKPAEKKVATVELKPKAKEAEKKPAAKAAAPAKKAEVKAETAAPAKKAEVKAEVPAKKVEAIAKAPAKKAEVKTEAAAPAKKAAAKAKPADKAKK
jgi:small subunit ribosomal protein S2